MQIWYVWGPISFLAIAVLGFLGWELSRTNQPKRQANRAQNATPVTGGPNPITTGAISPLMERGWHSNGQHHNSYERRYWTYSLWLTAVVAVGAGLSAGFAYDAARQAGKQVKASREANRMNAESGRAWVGPNNVSIRSPMVDGQGLKATINYQNFGREPGTGLSIRGKNRVFDASEWNDRKHQDFVTDLSNICLSDNEIKRTTRVVYPSINSQSYEVIYDSTQESLFPEDRVAVSPGVLNGSETFVLLLCFTYKSNVLIRHSSACFFFNKTVSDAANLNICAFGNDAN